MGQINVHHPTNDIITYIFSFMDPVSCTMCLLLSHDIQKRLLNIGYDHYILQKSLFVFNVVRYNHPPLLIEWGVDYGCTVDINQRFLTEMAALNGNLELLKTLTDVYSVVLSYNVIIDSVKSNSVDILTWLIKEEKLNTGVLMNSIYNLVSLYGNIDTLKWLFAIDKNYSFSLENICKIINRKDIELIKYVISTSIPTYCSTFYCMEILKQCIALEFYDIIPYINEKLVGYGVYFDKDSGKLILTQKNEMMMMNKYDIL